MTCAKQMHNCFEIVSMIGPRPGKVTALRYITRYGYFKAPPIFRNYMAA